MKSFFIDTNYILRYLIRDVPSQAMQVRAVLTDAKNRRISLKIDSITIVEVVYQLENWYKLSKKEAAEKLMLFISPEWIILDDKNVISESLALYPQMNIDLVDIILFLKAKSNDSEVLSFDKDFEKLQSFYL